MKQIYLCTILTILCSKVIFGQATFETRDKIALSVKIDLATVHRLYSYNYVLINGPSAKENVYKFEIHLTDSIEIDDLHVPKNWDGVVFNEGRTLVRWGADVNDSTGKFKDILQPRGTRSGFSFAALVLPGIVDYYAEGWAPFPSFEEGEATDSIPGYSDLTPYGPGVVGKTIGPVQLPEPFAASIFLDTLLSYVHQAHELGWINNTRDDDAEEDERAEDGVVKNLDKRLELTRDLLERQKITQAKNHLQRFLGKVEKLWKRQQKEEEKNRKNPRIIFTSEAYALLKYNGEYLLDHLKETKEEKEDKGKAEKK